VCFVINCDAPREKGDKGKGEDGVISIDTYLHRVGRTGRYSDKGIALTIVPGEKDKKYLVESV
jgi:superfamily II DNA/RNA helicase